MRTVRWLVVVVLSLIGAAYCGLRWLLGLIELLDRAERERGGV